MNRAAPALVLSPTPERSTPPIAGTSSFITSSSTWFIRRSNVSPIGDALADWSLACSSFSCESPMAGACCSM